MIIVNAIIAYSASGVIDLIAPVFVVLITFVVVSYYSGWLAARLVQRPKAKTG